MFLLAAVLDWHSVLFLLFALLACGFAAAVLVTSNIVRMAFYLTLSLGATAGLFFLAGSEFVGSMQLLIYVGGTLVLLIFGVMLTAQARFVSMKTSAGEWVLGAIVGASLFGVLLFAAFNVEDWRTPRPDRNQIALAESKTSTPIGLALAGVRVDRLEEPNEQLRAGMSGYLLPFVIVSMHLLVVLIGAGYMARTKRVGAARVPLRPATVAAPRDRRRSRLVTAGLASGLAINFLLAVACFALMQRPAASESAANANVNSVLTAIEQTLVAAPDWLLPTLGLLFLVNVLLLMVVWYWQKWGVIGLVLVPVVQALLIGNSSVGPALATGFLIFALAPVVMLIVLLCSGRRPTTWSQME
ncbi:MAG: NADH-quinone oxidoreductase subunit J [Pirellulaceae bacterium]